MLQKHWTAQILEEFGNQIARFTGGIWSALKEVGLMLFRVWRWISGHSTTLLSKVGVDLFSVARIVFRYAVDTVAAAFLSAAMMFVICWVLSQDLISGELAKVGPQAVTSVASIIGILVIFIFIIPKSTRNLVVGWNVSYFIMSWFLLLGFDPALSPWSLLRPFSLYPLYLLTALGFALVLAVIVTKEMLANPNFSPQAASAVFIRQSVTRP